MAWYTISDVKHSKSFPSLRRLEVIAVGDWEKPRIITASARNHSLLVVLVQPL